MKQNIVEETNEINSHPIHTWNEISLKPNLGTLRIFRLGEEPEIVYIITSGYNNPQMYHVIFEDGYESPIITQFWTAMQIKDNLNIDL